MAKTPPRNRLLVEGTSDRGAIAEIIEKNGVLWTKDKTGNFPVDIANQGGFTEVLKSSVLKAELKQSELEALGLIVDADNNPMERWARIQRVCQDFVDEMPQNIPQNGFLCTAQNSAGKPVRFGVWLMPNNEDSGVLENFLAGLVANKNLWKYAEAVVQEAKQKGATFDEKRHIAKANIHTWLAWQDEPGMGFGVAIAKEYLDPYHACLEPFVRWFKDLYNLDHTNTEF